MPLNLVTQNEKFCPSLLMGPQERRLANVLLLAAAG
jgi:hypothetical protein